MNKRQRRGPTTVADYIAQRNADPGYQREQAELVAGRPAREVARREEQKPILDDLRSAGITVASVWDFVNTREPYPVALPILFDHLKRGGYSDWTMSGLARSLSVRPMAFAWETFRQLYLRASGSAEQDGLAIALSVTATREHLEELIALLGEESRGPSRLLLMRGIKRIGGDRGRDVIASLVDDPTFGTEARARLKQRASGAAGAQEVAG